MQDGPHGSAAKLALARAATARHSTSTASGKFGRQRVKVSPVQAERLASDSSSIRRRVGPGGYEQPSHLRTAPGSMTTRTAGPHVAGQPAASPPTQADPPTREQLTAAVNVLQVRSFHKLRQVAIACRAQCREAKPGAMYVLAALHRRGYWQACGLRKRKPRQQGATCILGAPVTNLLACDSPSCPPWTPFKMYVTRRGSERQLKDSGVVLSGLRATKEPRALFGDPVWRFAMPARAELPFHRFTKGDPVILSAKLRYAPWLCACHVRYVAGAI